MLVAVLVFDGVTALDAVGPYEVLRFLPDTEVVMVGLERGTVRDARGSLGLVVDRTLEEVPTPDMVIVPGGPGEAALRTDERLLSWLRAASEGARWTASVCTGSCTLAAAGLLAGKPAATHWASRDELAALGAVPVDDRVVVGERVVTSAGVSAGIDMALRLAAIEAGDEVAQTIQLILEYDPQPPFDAGSPAKAPPQVLERLSAARTRG